MGFPLIPKSKMCFTDTPHGLFVLIASLQPIKCFKNCADTTNNDMQKYYM